VDYSGAISFGIYGTFAGLIVLVVVVFLIWKVAKMIWAAFSG
jgi:hypothetical protein